MLKEHTTFPPKQLSTFAFLLLSILVICLLLAGACRNIALVDAAQRGNINMVRFLLDSGANPNADDDGSHPLGVAVNGKHISVMQLLIAKGADVNAKGAFNSTPLLYAATSDTHVVSFLLQHGANVNAQDNDGQTPLMIASENADIDIVQTLLLSGAKVSIKDNSGQTALMKVASIQYDVPANNLVSTTKALLSSGANVNDKDNTGNTPMAMALKNGHSEVAILLKKAGERVACDSSE